MSTQHLTQISGRLLAAVAIVGAAIGGLQWALSWLLVRYAITPLFCGSTDIFSTCAHSGLVAELFVLLISCVVALAAMVRLHVFRPLLVIILVNIAILGLYSTVNALRWYEAAPWLMLVYALAYTTFTWIVSIVRFSVAIALGVIIAVATRFIG